MLGYIPRAVQLRLFRYALSKLDFIDHSTYDLERDFNLSLGFKNDLQMKNISLNVAKISSMLALPPSICIRSAKVSLLHIRIPADLHKAPVKVSISGVVIDAEVQQDSSSTTQTEGDAPLPPFDQGGLSDSYGPDQYSREGFRFPSGMDLTSSFLQEEPMAAKEVEATLKAELERDQSAGPESDSDEDEYFDDAGLGTPLSLWNFVPSFFQRLVDRVEIDIKAVSFRLEVPYDLETLEKLPDMNHLTVQFDMDSLEIEGVTLASSPSNTQTNRLRQSKPGMRAIRLDGIKMSLLGHPEFFESPLSFGLPRQEDVDTVKSDSTILPSTSTPTVTADTPRMDSRTAESSRVVPETSTRSSVNTQNPSHSFFAPMQQPFQAYEQPSIPSHQVPNTLPSPQPPSPPTSASSEEVDSALLSQSILFNEDHGLSQSDIDIEGLEDDGDANEPLPQLYSRRHPEFERYERPLSYEIDRGDYSDDEDSLKNEPRNFDLYQEPNTKFFGVPNASLALERTLGAEAHQFSQRHTLEHESQQRLVDSFPQPHASYLSITHPQPTSESRNARAAFLDSGAYDEDPNSDMECSNPDMLYLSEPVVSNVSSLANSLVQRPNSGSDIAASSLAISGIQVEPKVIYTHFEDGDDDGNNSDNSSVYKSYPASEVAESSNPIVGNQIASPHESQDTQPGTSMPNATQSELPVASFDNSTSVELPTERNSSPLADSTDLNDNEYQKVKGYAAQLPQNLPPPSPPPLSPSPISHSDNPSIAGSQLVEESLPVPTLSRVPSSEGSEAALAESMIFTHEEAGSLYMSALGGSQPLVTSRQDDTRPPEDFTPSLTPHSSRPSRMVRKYILRVNYIDLFVPGIASTNEKSSSSTAESSQNIDAMAESAYLSVPGSFSGYAANRPTRKKASSSKKPKPTVSFQMTESTQTDPLRKSQSTQATSNPTNIDIEIGRVEISVDLAVGKKSITIANDMIKLLQGDNLKSSKVSAAANMPKDDENPKPLNLRLSLASLDIALLETLPGENLLLGEDGKTQKPLNTSAEQPFQGGLGTDAPVTILTLSLRQLALKKTAPGVSASAYQSVTEITLHGCSLKVADHEIIGFIRPTREKREPRRSEKPDISKHVFLLRITDRKDKQHIEVQTVPVKLFFPTRGIEDMMMHFGGLESMLSMASSSSLTSNIPSSLPSKADTTKAEALRSSGTIKPTTFTVNIAGMIVEIFVSDLVGGIGISTSSIRIQSSDQDGLSVQIPQLAVFGPDFDLSGTIDAASTLVSFESIKIDFESKPNNEDLERLLEMITPSIDRYGNEDEVMVDVLLRQRRRGSVLRLDVKRLNGTMRCMQDISRFSIIAEELAKMGTVAKYIPQDERPGMLSLVLLKSVSLDLYAGEELQNFHAMLGDVEVCHIAAPTLLALGVGQVSLNRKAGKTEEWVGESFPRSLVIAKEEDKNRPMIRLRMIGDEPEPEIKIKIWNTRFEYHVKSLLALLSLNEKDTSDVIATNMVDSIAHLAEREVTRQLSDSRPGITKKGSGSPNAQPLRVNIGLSSVSVGLNPLNMSAKALFVVHEGSFVCQVSSRDPFSAALTLSKANLLVIDDSGNLTNPQRQLSEPRHRRHDSKENLISYTSQGYVSVLTVSSAKINLKLENDERSEGKNMLVNIADVFIVVESCADSTQTVIGVMNGLKPPLPESEEIKYMTEVMPVDVFANLDENAFVPTVFGQQPRNLRSLEEMPEDLFEDEVPFNSQLIESYYPSRNLPAIQSDVGVQSQPQMVAGFHDQVRVVAEEPLNFDDGYFPESTKPKEESAAPKVIPRRTSVKANVRNLQLIWNLHEGYDWHKTRNTISKAVKEVEERASRRRRHPERLSTTADDTEDEEETETYDVLFNSIYITLPKHRDPKDLSRDIQNQIRGDYEVQSETGSYAPTTTTMESQVPRYRSSEARRRDLRYRRSQRNTMQFELKGVDVDFAIFAPDGQELQSSVDLRIQDILVTENVRTSTWRKFLTYMREAGDRERGQPMAHIHLDTLRPIPELAATELSIKVKLLPLRLYVDQDALEFLTRFFEFKDPDAAPSGEKVEEPFIQRCEIDTIRVKLDFKPKRVDYAGLRSGRTTEFMNFFILDEADMELRHVALNGVSGFERLGKDLNNIWMPDIRSNQLPGVLAGVAPVRSLVNIGTGVRDLVKVPIMEYRKDGRLVRSIKKGTQHFVKTSGSEFVRLGAKLAIGTQTILEKTEGFLVGEQPQARQYPAHRETDSGDEDAEINPAVFSPYANQPLGVVHGLMQAREGFTRNINEAKEAIMRVPTEAAEGGSAKSAAAALLRAAPTAVIRPMIGVTEAVHNTLHGIDNTIDRDKREKIRDKYKNPS
ncbi:hypothetical protein ABW19_dt0206612 [Dactylella cylindrospora]|nr:hypothetical protein ABW19_dt0206612 [Dactylella cylindrospora]